MTPQEYDDTYHYIKRNIDTITQYAYEHCVKEKLQEMLKEYWDEAEANKEYEFQYDELDHWHAYGDRVDLNFVSRNLQEIKCFAYPVVNGVPNYDEEYEIELVLPKEQ